LHGSTETDRLRKGLKSLDFAFFEFLSLDEQLKSYISSQGITFDEDKIKRFKLNLLNDVIIGKVSIDEFVDKKT